MTNVSESSTNHIFHDWRQDLSMAGSGPPFETAFYVARVTITTNLTEIVKTVSFTRSEIFTILLYTLPLLYCIGYLIAVTNSSVWC